MSDMLAVPDDKQLVRSRVSNKRFGPNSARRWSFIDRLTRGGGAHLGPFIGGQLGRCSNASQGVRARRKSKFRRGHVEE